ncbi:hypothetical protein B296_00042188 [Ensete ventricosum]|uniref:Uncharacterized protein n=1 Tax=Ensete ventricosum TaxID=4639 RepID=A0A426Y782_ENSVE|nr:hypothetical protein B296_00042188 [Ensete ventricosum]
MAQPLARGRLVAAKAPLQRGGQLRPGPLQGVATRRGNSRTQARPAAAKPQSGCKGLSQRACKGVAVA